MKNKSMSMIQRGQGKNLDWLNLDETEDDFLSGKVPNELHDGWEDEE